MNAADLKGKTVGFLASGGLDSCTITHWLSSQGVKVVTFTADLGQPDEKDLNDVADRMRQSGAVEANIVDLKEQVAQRGLEIVQAQATYEGGYWLSTPIGRYVTVKGILPLLADKKIDVLAHGATGRGNDQCRFALVTNMYAPQITVYAPWRDQLFLDAFAGGGRDEMIDYCEAHNVPLRHSKTKPYSTDANLIGLTHEAGSLESLEVGANFVQPEMGNRVMDAPDMPAKVSIEFEKGRPVALNGEKCKSLAQVFERLNAVAGLHAVGINLHMLENRFVGTKSRGVYEQPGIELLGTAYGYLLQAILDRRAKTLFDQLSDFLANQMYSGYGEDFASQMCISAIDKVASMATGVVEVSLYKGNILFEAIRNVEHSLYIEENASMANVAGYDHRDSEGFLNVLGLSASAIGKAGLLADVDLRNKTADDSITTTIDDEIDYATLSCD